MNWNDFPFKVGDVLVQKGFTSTHTITRIVPPLFFITYASRSNFGPEVPVSMLDRDGKSFTTKFALHEAYKFNKELEEILDSEV